MVDLLKGNHKRLFSPKKMERDEKKNELLNFIREYRLPQKRNFCFIFVAVWKKFTVRVKKWN